MFDLTKNDFLKSKREFVCNLSFSFQYRAYLPGYSLIGISSTRKNHAELVNIEESEENILALTPSSFK